MARKVQMTVTRANGQVDIVKDCDPKSATKVAKDLRADAGIKSVRLKGQR